MEEETKGRRGKSQEKKDHDAQHVYSTLQVKLRSFIQPAFVDCLHPLLNRVADTLSRIAFEAYLLANFHVHRLIHEQKTLPPLDQSFFYSCCSLVTCSAKKRKDAGSEDLRISAAQYKCLRPVQWTVPNGDYLGHAMASLAREMKTMTQNHIVLNVLRRLTRYVRLRYGLKNGKEAASFIRSCFMDSDLSVDQIHFKEWIEINPSFEDTVKKNMNHFIVKLADVLRYYETLEESKPKGIRKFTLLPLKGSYVGSFFMIDPTTLPDLVKLLSRNDQERIVHTMISRFTEGSDEVQFLHARLKAKAIFTRQFQQMPRIAAALWDTLFLTKRYETLRRKFAKLVSTNGYAVTVYMQIPKVGDGSPKEYDSSTGLNENDYEEFIAIDPGGTFVCTAYSGVEKNAIKSEYTQVSTREIRHDSKMNERKQWDVRQRRSNTEYANVLRNVPSLKTASFETFCARVKQMLAVAEFLFTFSKRPVFRGWRFKTSRFGKKALVKAVKKVVGNRPPEEILVGFGDWSQQDGFIRGQEKAPVKKIRRMMRERGIKVISIDEHRTSKCCSRCHEGEMENVSYGEGEAKKRCHQVVRCRNSELCGMVWQRDVNAARNIRSVMLNMIRGEERPHQLKRQRKEKKFPLIKEGSARGSMPQ
jgi:hypothetical protein